MLGGGGLCHFLRCEGGVGLIVSSGLRLVSSSSTDCRKASSSSKDVGKDESAESVVLGRLEAGPESWLEVELLWLEIGRFAVAMGNKLPRLDCSWSEENALSWKEKDK